MGGSPYPSSLVTTTFKRRWVLDFAGARPVGILEMMSDDRPATRSATQAARDARTRIETAFNPQLLEKAGRRFAEIVSEHLDKVIAGEVPTICWQSPAEHIANAKRSMNHCIGSGTAAASLATGSSAVSHSNGIGDLVDHFSELVRNALAGGLNLHHPHYVGHQVPASVPLAGLFDALGAITNQVMAIYEMGPWAAAVERAVLDIVGGKIGFVASEFSGAITSGASLANLTGLLTARNVALADVWQKGLTGHAAPVLVAHADAHYSISRAAAILGLGTDHIIPAGLDTRRAIEPNQLDDTLTELRRDGTPIIAVSAAACATPIGAFDPLEEISQVCRRHEVWLHVDAAHGGAACMSRRYRHLVAGLEQADSVVCDAHKMFFMPALCALLFFRDRKHRFRAFDQDAPYLFDPTAPELAEYDSGLRVVECSKRAAAFGLWGIWSMFGPTLFEDMVDTTFDLAKEFHALLHEAEDFETLHNPECNVVVFRYLPKELRDYSTVDVDEFQLRLRRHVVESGEFYLVANRLEGRNVLRTTIINPVTRIEHLRELMQVLRRHAQHLL